MKVLLVDDHTLVRKGIASLLASRNIEVVGEAANGREALEKVRQVKPTVVLMDVQMPEMDGIQATLQIKTEMPDVKVVMLTVCEEDSYLFEAIRAGADGYIFKNLKAEQFFDLLSALDRGETAMTPALARRVINEFARKTPREQSNDSPDQLTARETDVLMLISQGESNRIIAERLQITENTVKFHLRNVMDKLHLRNRTLLATYALNKGIGPSAQPNP